MNCFATFQIASALAPSQATCPSTHPVFASHLFSRFTHPQTQLNFYLHKAFFPMTTSISTFSKFFYILHSQSRSLANPGCYPSYHNSEHLLEVLLCTRHHAKCFTGMTLFNPHSSPMMSFLLSFTEMFI